MRTCIAVGATLAVVLLVGGVMAGEGIKSGPQPGTGLVPFEPDNVTGVAAGRKQCLV